MPDEKKAPGKPTYNDTGMQNVEDDMFLHEEETGHAEETQVEEPAQTEEEPDETSQNTEEVETVDTEESPTEEVETEPVEPEEPRLYANKYKSVEALETAFTELGGDPARYKGKPELLEEAYQVRSGEFTRKRQDETARPQVEETGDQDLDSLMGKIKWEDVTDAQSLAKQIFSVVADMNKNRAPQQALDPQQMLGEIRRVEKATTELAEVEREVPRLQTDVPFRNAFAHFILDQKRDGAYVSIKRSMSDFLGTARKVDTEAAKRKMKEDKNAAGQPDPGSTQSVTKTVPADELSAIAEAYQKHKGRFG